MSAIDHLFTLAKAYGDAAHVEPVTVSYRAFKDSKKLRALRSGASITVKRVETTIEWFSDNWPANTPWPADVPRPASAVVAA